MKCPICGKVVEETVREFPFCSDRCRLIDLGRWLDGKYQIPVERPGDRKEPGEDEVPGDE